VPGQAGLLGATAGVQDGFRHAGMGPVVSTAAGTGSSAGGVQ
jgi:hypothetical protein